MCPWQQECPWACGCTATSTGWSCGRQQSVQRGKSSAVVSRSWSVVHILCVPSDVFRTWVTAEFLLLIRPPHYLVIQVPWPASHLLFAFSLPDFAPQFDTSVHRECSSIVWRETPGTFFMGIERPGCSQELQVLPGQNFLFLQNTWGELQRFGGNEKENGRKAQSIPLCVRDAQGGVHSNKSFWKSILDNRGLENFRNNIFITLKGKKTKWFCFFSLLLSFSSNQTTQCVIRHLFLLTPQVLRDVTASLCYRCSHSCFRRILVSVENQTLRRSTFSISPNGTESKDRKSENLISERRHFLKENERNRGVGTCFVKVHTHCSPFGLLTSSVIRLNHSVKTSLCVTPLWPRRWPQWVRSQPLCSHVGKL